jgi:hypothetical protein
MSIGRETDFNDNTAGAATKLGGSSLRADKVDGHSSGLQRASD